MTAENETPRPPDTQNLDMFIQLYGCDAFGPHNLTRVAIAELSALRARVAELEATTDRALAEMVESARVEIAAKDRAKSAEAEVARLREVLKDIADRIPNCRCGGCSWCIARAALAPPLQADGGSDGPR